MPEKSRSTLSVWAAVGTAPVSADFMVSGGWGGVAAGIGGAAAGVSQSRSSRAVSMRPRTGLVSTCVAPCI